MPVGEVPAPAERAQHPLALDHHGRESDDPAHQQHDAGHEQEDRGEPDAEPVEDRHSEAREECARGAGGGAADRRRASVQALVGHPDLRRRGQQAADEQDDHAGEAIDHQRHGAGHLGRFAGPRGSLHGRGVRDQPQQRQGGDDRER